MAYLKPLLTQIALDLLSRLLVCDPKPEQIIAAESLIATLFGEKRSTCHVRLQPNEWRCLYWAAQGKSIKETAVILNLSPHTIKNYQENIKEKLACKKLIRAVYLLATELESYVIVKK